MDSYQYTADNLDSSFFSVISTLILPGDRNFYPLAMILNLKNTNR